MLPFVSAETASRWKAALAHDYFPDLDRALRRRLWNPPGGLSLAAAVALACGLYLHPQGIVVFAGLAAVLAIGVAGPWLNVRFVRAAWTFDRGRCTEGDAVTACWTIHNRAPWTSWNLIARADSDGPTAVVPSVAPFERVERAIRFVPARRGVYPREGSAITSGFPFGFWTARRPAGAPEPLIVWPKTYVVGSLPESAGGESVEGVVAPNKPGHAGDVTGVRPYRRGDSPRRIHWPQSARHDRLIVCELQSNARPVVEIVLDADPAALAGDARDWAVRAAASLYDAWAGRGAEVALVAGDVVVSPASGARQRRRVFDALARFPDDGPPLPRVLRRPIPSSVQLVVTGTADVPSEPGRYLLRFGRSPRRRDSWLTIVDPADTPTLLKRGGRS